MARDASEVANDFCGLARRRGLNYGQVETVIAVLRQVAADFSELDQKGTRLALAPGQAFEMTQKGGLMLTTEQNARCAGGLAGRQRLKQTLVRGQLMELLSASRIPLGSGGRRHRTSALAVFRMARRWGFPAPRK